MHWDNILRTRLELKSVNNMFVHTLSSLFVAIIGDMGDGVFGKAWVTSGVGGDDLEFDIGAILGGGE